MPEDTTRKFGLWDAMVLVAATAVGLAVFPHAFGDLSTYAIRLLKLVSNLSAPQRDWRDGTVSIYYIFAQFAGLLLPFCSAWSLCVILLRLRKPRPALRQIAVQPVQSPAVQHCSRPFSSHSCWFHTCHRTACAA